MKVNNYFSTTTITTNFRRAPNFSLRSTTLHSHYTSFHSGRLTTNVIRTKTSPHSIGLGFAIGTFISILPTPGFNILLGLLVLFIFKKVSKFSLFAGIIFWKPLFSIPIYYFSYQIGDLLFGQSTTMVYELTIFARIYVYARRFLIGNIILTLIISLCSYFILRGIFTLYYKRNPSAHEDDLN